MLRPRPSLECIMSFRAIASNSLGHPTVHPIVDRLTAAKQHGFNAVEIVDEDLEEHARTVYGDVTASSRLSSAHDIRTYCDELKLTVVVFQPFRFYEGLIDRTEHLAMIEKLKLWLKIAAILKTEIIQIPTNWLQEGTTSEKAIIVEDLREMADMGLQQRPVIRFAYEGVAWGTHIDTWEGTWEIVQAVDRANFGLCLDTFHIVGRVWGDPTSVTGKAETADEDLANSLRELVQDLDMEKVFYVQAGDAERLEQPLLPGSPFYNEQQRPRMSWSRNARLFPYETDKGGFLPITDVLECLVTKKQYKGIISLELFSRSTFDASPDTPNCFGKRASQSWNTMATALGI
jgi:4-hydroxyphenylpyruvate dioxygenase